MSHKNPPRPAPTRTSRPLLGLLVLALSAMPLIAVDLPAAAVGGERTAGRALRDASSLGSSGTTDSRDERRVETMPAGSRTARTPLYRDPPSYKGVKRSPQTLPVAGRTATLGSGGENPDVYVDEAGTAHIVWNEGRGSAADVAVYCRLPRGASACVTRAELSWPKSYGPGDGEFLNVDNIGPRILRVGDQLLVLSTRFPTYGEKPSGRGDTTVLAWSSLDGGGSWSPPAIIGSNVAAEYAVAGTAEHPVILGYGQSVLCTPKAGQPDGHGCLVAYRGGQFASGAAILNGPTSADDHYSTITAAPGPGEGRAVVAAMSNTNGSTWVRSWRGPGEIDDPGAWTMSAAMAGAEPVLATGPGGTYLMTRGGVENPILGEVRVRRLVPAADGSLAEQPPVILSEGGRLGRLAQDPSGRLHGAWIENAGVTYRSAEPGSLAFSPRQVLVPGLDNGQWRLSATADGGGFTVLNHAGGEIVAASFGSPAPTGRPGLAGLPGGGNASCTQVGFGAFELTSKFGCFLQGAGNAKGLLVSDGPVRLNGLDIVPEPGSRLVFDPKRLTIDTVSSVVGSKDDGQARVLLRNAGAEIELFKGRLQLDYPKLKPGAPLFDFDPKRYATDVLGFPVSSSMPVSLTKDGVRIPVEVALPKAFGGFTGKAVLIGDTAGGLRLDSLDVAIGPLPLGALVVKASVHWQSGGTWRGEGMLTVAKFGTVEAKVAFETGRFESADVSYTPDIGIAVGPKVYLTRVAGGLSLEPTTLYAEADVSLVVPRSEAPISATGRFRMTFPDKGPGVFKLAGSVKVLTISVADGSVEYHTDGYAAFRGNAQVDFGPLKGQARMDGFVDARTGDWGASMGVGTSLCRDVEDPTGQAPPRQVCTGDLEVALSQIGLAACAGDVGISFRWEETDDLGFPFTALTVDCDTGPYKVPPPRGRVAADGAVTFEVPRRLPSVTFAVPGDGAKPGVQVTGPDGSVIVGPGASGEGVSMFSVGTGVYIRLDQPKGGAYTVSPQPGSAIGQVLVSHGLEPAKVRGSVSKSGGKVALRWKAEHLGGGQRIRFVERGAFGTRIIGETGKKKGTIRFRPVAASGRRRTVEAVRLVAGLPRGTVRIDRFQAARPARPGAVRRLRARAGKRALVVSLRAGRGSAWTVVRVKGSAGSLVTRSLPRKARRLRIAGLRWDRKLKITVRGVSRDGRPGPTRHLVIRR